MSKRYWLIKSEEDEFSLDHLKAMPRQTSPWDGVRNYQARNFMRDDMQVGDLVLYYHSRCAEPGVVGLAEVASEAYPDPTQWDAKSKYYDAKSTEDNPRWMLVDIRWKSEFKNRVSLHQMKEDTALAEMLVCRKGQRLSIQPVDKEHYLHVVALGKANR